ncbi:hypothetical protein ON010_g9615 [Phytophthora cinnamomi]|nr:hypothetical protein ON010_g9615 [Phytophthora cinnamomi]
MPDTKLTRNLTTINVLCGASLPDSRRETNIAYRQYMYAEEGIQVDPLQFLLHLARYYAERSMQDTAASCNIGNLTLEELPRLQLPTRDVECTSWVKSTENLLPVVYMYQPQSNAADKVRFNPMPSRRALCWQRWRFPPASETIPGGSRIIMDEPPFRMTHPSVRPRIPLKQGRVTRKRAASATYSRTEPAIRKPSRTRRPVRQCGEHCGEHSGPKATSGAARPAHPGLTVRWPDGGQCHAAILRGAIRRTGSRATVDAVARDHAGGTCPACTCMSVPTAAFFVPRSKILSGATPCRAAALLVREEKKKPSFRRYRDRTCAAELSVGPGARSSILPKFLTTRQEFQLASRRQAGLERYAQGLRYADSAAGRHPQAQPQLQAQLDNPDDGGRPAAGWRASCRRIAVFGSRGGSTRVRLPGLVTRPRFCALRDRERPHAPSHVRKLIYRSRPAGLGLRWAGLAADSATNAADDGAVVRCCRCAASCVRTRPSGPEGAGAGFFGGGRPTTNLPPAATVDDDGDGVDGAAGRSQDLLEAA